MNHSTVNILEKQYVIRGDADSKYINEVACLVDQRMRELEEKSPHLGQNRLAVLVAINLADELLQERLTQEEENTEYETARRTSELISLLDEGLIADSP